MKKLIISFLSVVLVSLAASAQISYKKIWGQGRYTNIGYSFASTKAGGYKDNGSFGISLTKGASYLFPSKPVAGMLKFGFDINWFDISFAKYKSVNREMNPEDFFDSDFDDDYGYDYGEEDFDINIGRMSLLVGALGIGPNVSIAPFSSFNNQARFLKASIYFHYQPTFGAYFVAENGDYEASYAYCNMFQFGGKITWKFIGLGVEGHWGSGKFKQLGFDEEAEDISGILSTSSNKITRTFSNTRVYISFRF